MSIPLVSALQALLAPGARQKNDHSTLDDLDVHRHAEHLPHGMQLTWLGTAGFRLEYEGHSLLIDPYLTRPSLARTFGPRALRPSAQRIASHVRRADAVLLTHTHFDHALDVPPIAAANGCNVYGSSSLAKLMQLHGLAERAVVVTPLQVYELGPFQVTFVESAHSKLVLGMKVPFDGELTCDHLDGLRGSAYHCGQTFGIHIAVGGVTFYHQGSANLRDDCLVHHDVDYFLCCVAGRGFTPDYTQRVLSRLSPRVIIPHHFDDFFRPLDSPLEFSLNVNLGGFVEEVRRVSGDFRVRTLQPLVSW